MMHSYPARATAAFIALQCWIAVGWTIMDYRAVHGLIPGLFMIFKLYTHIAISLIAIVFTAIAADYRMIGRPAVLGKMVITATILFGIYWTFKGWADFPNSLLRVKIAHAFVPIEVILFWLAFGNLYILKWHHTLLWTAFPLIYTIFTLVYGKYTGNYAYEFANIERYGLFKVLLIVGLTIAGSLVLGGAMVSTSRYLHRRDEESRMRNSTGDEGGLICDRPMP